jgi:hypothetical protein
MALHAWVWVWSDRNNWGKVPEKFKKCGPGENFRKEIKRNGPQSRFSAKSDSPTPTPRILKKYPAGWDQKDSRKIFFGSDFFRVGDFWKEFS